MYNNTRFLPKIELSLSDKNLALIRTYLYSYSRRIYSIYSLQTEM